MLTPYMVTQRAGTGACPYESCHLDRKMEWSENRTTGKHLNPLSNQDQNDCDSLGRSGSPRSIFLFQEYTEKHENHPCICTPDNRISFPWDQFVVWAFQYVYSSSVLMHLKMSHYSFVQDASVSGNTGTL